MAIVKEIEIRVQDQQAQQNIGKLNDLFKQVDTSVDKAESSTMSLRAELRKLQQDMASGRLSGAEFNAAAQRAGTLRDTIGDVSQRVNVLASDTQGLDAALSVGSGLAGAFSAAQGTMAVFGAESEDVQKAILKVQGSLAILNGVQAVANTLNKDSALMIQLQTRGITMLGAAQKAYSLVVGTSTGMLKLFRIALISTGIGALVVGVGLLIANFEKISKWVTDLIDKFGGWRKVLMFVAPPIFLIIKALEALGIIDDEQTSKAKKNAEERINNSRKESQELDKRKTSIGAYYDFEIRKAKAAGKETEEVEKLKRIALLKTLQAQNALERAWIRTGEASQEDIKRWNERQAAITALLQDIQIAEIESQTKTEEEKNKVREKQKQAAEKRREDEKKRLEQQAQEEYRIFEESVKARDAAIEEQIKKREEFAKIEEEEEMSLLDADLQSFMALERAKTDALEAEMQGRIDIQEAYFSVAEGGVSVLKSVFEKSKAIQKVLIVAESAMGIARIIQATQAANAADRAAAALMGAAGVGYLATKLTLNKVGAAVGIAANVGATAKALQALGGGGGGGSAGANSGGGSGGGSAPSFNLVGDAGMNQIAQGQAGQQPVEAYVVAGNVTTAQSLNRNIINNATF